MKCDYLGTEYGGFPVSLDLINDGDLVYDFGVGEDVSFSRSLVEEKNCEVHLFDFTPQSIKWFREEYLKKDNMTYHEYGVSDFDGELKVHYPNGSRRPAWMGYEHNETHPVKTIQTIMKELNHDNIDILKMDVEGEEYKIIPQMISQSILPKQICLEVHHRFLTKSNIELHKDMLDLLMKTYFVCGVVDNQEILFVRQDIYNENFKSDS